MLRFSSAVSSFLLASTFLTGTAFAQDAVPVDVTPPELEEEIVEGEEIVVTARRRPVSRDQALSRLTSEQHATHGINRPDFRF